MTVGGDQPAKPVDPQASLRAELLGEISGAQATLEAAIAELSRAGNSSGQLAESRSHLSLLSNLGLQLGTASGAALASLRGEVTTAASAATNAAQQAHTAAADAANNSLSSSGYQIAAARAAVQQVADNYYDRRALNPYLQFTSDKDEEEYRRRERVNREAYEREMAKGTPAGDANAARIMERQLRDAGAHGADRSPEFQNMLGSVQEAEATLSALKPKQPEADNPAPAKAANDDLADVMPALRDAGVKTDESPSGQPSHGLADNNSHPRTASAASSRSV